MRAAPQHRERWRFVRRGDGPDREAEQELEETGCGVQALLKSMVPSADVVLARLIEASHRSRPSRRAPWRSLPEVELPAKDASVVSPLPNGSLARPRRGWDVGPCLWAASVASVSPTFETVGVVKFAISAPRPFRTQRDSGRLRPLAGKRAMTPCDWRRAGSDSQAAMALVRCSQTGRITPGRGRPTVAATPSAMQRRGPDPRSRRAGQRRASRSRCAAGTKREPEPSRSGMRT